MATFADDEDLDFEELWGSGGGGVDVDGKIIKVEGRRADATTEFGDEVWPGAAALAEETEAHRLAQRFHRAISPRERRVERRQLQEQ